MQTKRFVLLVAAVTAANVLAIDATYAAIEPVVTVGKNVGTARARVGLSTTSNRTMIRSRYREEEYFLNRQG
jgi:hypothetical protein